MNNWTIYQEDGRYAGFRYLGAVPNFRIWDGKPEDLDLVVDTLNDYDSLKGQVSDLEKFNLGLAQESHELQEALRGFLARFGSTPLASADLGLAKLIFKAREVLGKVRS